MARQKQNLTIIGPIAGINRRPGNQYQPPFSTYDSLNFLPFDCKTGRSVSATRPSVGEFPSPRVGVNALCRVNGAVQDKPLQSMICAAEGHLYWWDGDDWVHAGGGASEDMEYDIPIFPSTLLQRTYIPNFGGKPYVFDYVTGEVEIMVETAGTVPDDLRILATWKGALWGAGAITNPHVLYASRIGVATDWNFAANIDDEGGAFFTGGENEGLLRGPITALMPFTSDQMIVSTTEGLVSMKAHPRSGGIMEDIGGAYVLGQGAWCKGPDDALYFLTRLGVMTLHPNMPNTPMPVSIKTIPDELVGLPYDYEHPTVQMEYDSRWNGIIITVRGARRQAWWFDLGTGGFHRLAFPDYPMALMEFSPYVTEDTSGVLMGGYPYGGIGHFDRTAFEIFSSHLTLGPFQISPSPLTTAKLMNTRVVTVGETSTANGRLYLAMGADSEDAITRTDTQEWVWSVNLQEMLANWNRSFPIVAGASGAFQVQLLSGHLAVEEIHVTLAEGGYNRMSRRPSSQVVCHGYAEATPSFSPFSTEPSGQLLLEFDVPPDFPSYLYVDSETPGHYDNLRIVKIEGATTLADPIVEIIGGEIVLTIDDATPTGYEAIEAAFADLDGYSAIVGALEIDPVNIGRSFILNGGKEGFIADGVESINLAGLPDEWWENTNETGGNIRVRTAGNLGIPFDLIAFNRTEKTGCIIVRRPIYAVPEPLRLWVCDFNLATYPPGHPFGQYNAYPPWMLTAWPSGTGPNRTREPFYLDIPSPPGEEDPFESPSNGDEPEVCSPIRSGEEWIRSMGLIKAVTTTGEFIPAEGGLSTFTLDGDVKVVCYCPIEACEDGEAGEGNSGNYSSALVTAFFAIRHYIENNEEPDPGIDHMMVNIFVDRDSSLITTGFVTHFWSHEEFGIIEPKHSYVNHIHTGIMQHVKFGQIEEAGEHPGGFWTTGGKGISPQPRLRLGKLALPSPMLNEPPPVLDRGDEFPPETRFVQFWPGQPLDVRSDVANAIRGIIHGELNKFYENKASSPDLDFESAKVTGYVKYRRKDYGSGGSSMDSITDWDAIDAYEAYLETMAPTVTDADPGGDNGQDANARYWGNWTYTPTSPTVMPKPI